MTAGFSADDREFTCNGCAALVRGDVLSLGELPYWYGITNRRAEAFLAGRRFPALLAYCSACGLVQQPRAPWQDDLLSFVYTSEDASNPSAAAGGAGWGTEVAARFSALLNDLTPRRVLEIGCGRGHLLEGWKQRGVELAVGFEPSSRDWLTPSGAIVEGRSFSPERARAHADSFDLIYSFAVLEHLADVRRHVASLASLLTADGQLLVEVPNGYASLLDGDIGLFLHEHLSHFTPRSLMAILQSAGLEIVHLEHNRSEIIAHAVKSLKPSASNESLHGAESVLLSTYASRLQENLARIATIEWAPGMVALYGACATLCNLNAMISGDRCDRFAVLDSDSSKWGRRISGVAVDVIGPGDFNFTTEGTVIAVPYAFQDAILRALRERAVPSKLMPLYSSVRYEPAVSKS